ncbi:MAG: type II secretion system protein [Magnetococcales bacterium]|nr:type II secretion system protein [Magnetococcales bacterium]
MMKQAGFTMMEMIITITIMGLLTATLAIPYFSADSLSISDNKLSKDLRRTQHFAVEDGGSNAYSIGRSASGTNSYEITDPAGAVLDTITFSDTTVISNFSCDFNRIGVPSCTGASPITITAADGSGVSVTINPVTGFSTWTSF